MLVTYYDSSVFVATQPTLSAPISHPLDPLLSANCTSFEGGVYVVAIDDLVEMVALSTNCTSFEGDVYVVAIDDLVEMVALVSFSVDKLMRVCRHSSSSFTSFHLSYNVFSFRSQQLKLSF